MRMSNIERDYKSIIIAFLLLIGAAIQNGFFDELLPLAGMDAVSLIFSILLIGIFIITILMRKAKYTLRETILFGYFLCIFIIGFLSSMTSFSVEKQTLLMFRTAIYFVFTYLIFSSITLQEKSIIQLYRIAGACNALIYLYFYLIKSKIFGSGFRDVTINLYFSLFAIVLCLFVEIPKEKKLIKYAIVLLCAFTIVLSQQRSQIIPLAVIAIIYVVGNIRLNFKKILQLGVIFFIGYIVYSATQKSGVLAIVENRLEQATDTNSSLWIRTKTASLYLNRLNFTGWLFGKGLQSDIELEMLLPNYLYKYGIVGSLIIFCTTLIPAIKNGLKQKGHFQRTFLIGLFLISIGGLISGFGGQNGQFLVASILAIVCSSRISCQDKIVYTLPFA